MQHRTAVGKIKVTLIAGRVKSPTVSAVLIILCPTNKQIIKVSFVHSAKIIIISNTINGTLHDKPKRSRIQNECGYTNNGLK